MVDVQYNRALEILIASGLSITDIDLTANTRLKGAELCNTNLTALKKCSTTGLGIVYIEKTPYSAGKMLSVEQASHLEWSTEAITTNARDKDNGANNMATIKARNPDLSKYPAFKWCDDYGTDWYLPSINELRVVYRNKSTIDSTLSAMGYTILGTSYYWSSTEGSNYYDIGNSYYLDFSNGNSYDCDEDYTRNVRAVLAF